MPIADCFAKAGKALNGRDKAEIEALIESGMSEADAVQTHLDAMDAEIDGIAAQVEEQGGSVNRLEQGGLNSLGLYSAVERAVENMPLPTWKKTAVVSWGVRSPSGRKNHFIKTFNSEAEAQEFLSNQMNVDWQIVAIEDTRPANGTDIWAKIKSSPVKKEELEWLGIEEFLTMGGGRASSADPVQTKFTRNEVLSYIRENGVYIDEVVAADTAVDTEMDWRESIWDDPEAWQHDTDDMLSDFDQGESESGFFDGGATIDFGDNGINKWMDEWLDKHAKDVVNNYYHALAPDQQKELDAIDNYEDSVQWIIDNTDADPRIEMRSQARDDFEAMADQLAEESYKDNPYTINHDEKTDIYIFGNDDAGYQITTGGIGGLGQSTGLDAEYSYGEAQIQAEEYAREHELIAAEDDTSVAKWQEYIMEGDVDNYREIKLTLPEIEGDFYEEAHFPDRNVVAFLRVDDRELHASSAPVTGEIEIRKDDRGGYGLHDKDTGHMVGFARHSTMDSAKSAITNKEYSNTVGDMREEKNTYFIDEFQSDWHQGGRKQGYQTGEDAGEIDQQATNLKHEIVNDITNEAFAKYNVSKLVDLGFTDVSQTVGNVIKDVLDSGGKMPGHMKDVRDGRATPFANIVDVLSESDNLKDYLSRWEDYRLLLKRVEAERYGVPDAPFKGNAWLSLGLKRAIVDAVENGYEAIAWPNAEVLKDRWSERYGEMYANQYDKKMPSMVKRLTKIQPVQLSMKGGSVEHQEMGYWIIPITEDLKARITENALPLFQHTNKPRGYFDPERNRITFTDKADLSTFLHESGHAFLNMLRDLAPMDATIQRDIAVLDSWFVSQGAENDIQRHEMFASGFEAYLFEGKAPTPELNSMFSRFRSWLVMIYKRPDEIFRRNNLPGVTLTKEVREVMDRLVASDAAISAAQKQQKYQAASVSHLGLTPEQATEYQTLLDESDEEAKTELTAKVMRELQRELKSWWKQGVKEYADEVRSEMEDQRGYKARDYLTGDRIPEGMMRTALDAAYIKDVYGTQVSQKLQRMVSKSGGGHPDAIAPLFGYMSGDEMVREVLGTMTKKDRSAFVHAQAVERMKSKHGDMLNDGTITQVAEQIVHNNKQADLLLLELRNFNRSAGKQQTPRQYFKAAAEKSARDIPVDKLRPDIHRRNEIMARDGALKAAAEGDMAKAALEQHKAVRQFYLYRETTKAKEKADKHRDRLAQMKKIKYSAGQVRKDYLQQLKVLVSAYDLRKNPKDSEALLIRARNFIAAQKEGNPDLTADILLDSITSWKAMTMGDLEALRNAAENMLHLGKTEREKERDILRQEAKDLASSMDDHNIRPAKPATTNRSTLSRGRKFVVEFGAAHRKLESLLQELDGWKDNGPMAEAIFKPLWGATLKEMERLDVEHEALTDLFDGYKYLFSGFKDNLQDFKATKKLVDLYDMPAGELGADRSLSRGERIVLALNWGNEGNREALRSQEDQEFNDADVMEAIETLTPDELQLVNRIWKYIDKFYPEIAAMEYKATGVAPAKVEAVPFIVNGVEMRGGYYPLQADVSLSWRDEEHSVEGRAKELKQGGRVRASTKHGSTIERVGWDGAIVDLSIDTLFKHVDGLVHDITHREAIKKVDSLLRTKVVRKSAVKSIGREHYDEINKAVIRLAGGVTHPSDLKGLTKLMRHSRIATTYGAMGYSVRTGLINITGLFPAIVEVGKVRIVSSLLSEMANPLQFGREITKDSIFMTHRGKTMTRDVYEVQRNLKGRAGWNGFKAHAFWMIVKVDAFVSRAVWHAAKTKAENAGRSHEQAIYDADRTVANTQGTGLKIYLSSVEDQNEIYRAMSPMYTYFNAILNLAKRRAGKRSTGQISNAKWAEDMFWMFIMVALLEESMFGAGDDDETDKEMTARYAKSLGGYYLGQWWGVRELSSSIKYGRMFETPLQRTISSPWFAAKETLNLMFDPDAEFDKGSIRAYTDLLPVLGVPTGVQVNRIGKYLIDYEQNGGDFDPYGLVVTGKAE